MKIIDLLNKIANGEEVPKKVKYDNIYEYDYDEKNYAYFFIDHYNYLFDEDITQILDDEVEILEEEKKIPEKIYYVGDDVEKEIITNKINEIIDYFKSKGE